MQYYAVSYTLTRRDRNYDPFFSALRHIEVAQPLPRVRGETWLVRTRETGPGLAARLRALLAPLDTVQVVDAEAPPSVGPRRASTSDSDLPVG